MPTQCTQDSFDFGRVEGRAVVADFWGGTITSNAGALLLAQADRTVGIIDSFAACFGDGRNQGVIEHTLRTMVGQRVIGIALGHEDLVDHDDLRHDPVLAAVLGKLTPRRQDWPSLAGKSTLSRLEHSPQEGGVYAPPRYHTISHDGEAIERTLVDIALGSRRKPPAMMVIDLDATDSALHGHRAAPHGARRHGAGTRHLRHDPPQAAEDRRAGDRLGTPRAHRHGDGLPSPSDLRPRSRAIMMAPRA